MSVKVLVLRSAGTNCDKETAFAFNSAGAQAELVHINELKANKSLHKKFQIMALPGGFSYGDDISAGRIFANELKYTLEGFLKNFMQGSKLIIGICNGFQILVKAGILPGEENFMQSATLMLNDSAKFEDRWTYLKPTGSRCVWTQGMEQLIYLPVAHGEGKFIPKDDKALEDLKKNDQIVFQYVNKNGEFSGYPGNPNGSIEHIAGICDKTGRIFGLMPHPERHIFPSQHPAWSRLGLNRPGDGMTIFKNAVNFIKKS